MEGRARGCACQEGTLGESGQLSSEPPLAPRAPQAPWPPHRPQPLYLGLANSVLLAVLIRYVRRTYGHFQ